MRRAFVYGSLVALVWLGINACQHEPPRISDVEVSATVFNPAQGETVALSYTLNRSAQVTVAVRDALDRPVRTLAQGRQEAGRQTVQWDGRDDAGRLAPDEAYTWAIMAATGRAQAIYDPAGTGGLPVEIQDRALDQEDGSIHYRLDQPARVRLRLGIRGGALLRILLDWKPLPPGPHSVAWDGLDKDGLINLLIHPDIAYDLSAFALPENAVITTGNPASSELPFLDLPESPSPNPDPPVEAGTELHRHALHPRDACREPRFEITFPETVETTAEGWPVVQGRSPVRIVVDERDRRLVTESRFEVILYVDTIFLYEDEDSFTPYTYQWDTGGLNPGPHVITVNVHAYGDHIGTRSAVVVVQN